MIKELAANTPRITLGTRFVIDSERRHRSYAFKMVKGTLSGIQFG